MFEKYQLAPKVYDEMFNDDGIFFVDKVSYFVGCAACSNNSSNKQIIISNLSFYERLILLMNNYMKHKRHKDKLSNKQQNLHSFYSTKSINSSADSGATPCGFFFLVIMYLKP